MLDRFSVRIPIAIALGAIAGSLTRYYLTLLLARQLGTNFPYGTFFINITGSFAMGVIATIATERIFNLSPDVQLLIATGFLGSYTTFSTYELDTFGLLRGDPAAQTLDDRVWMAAFYWIGSASLGFLGLCGGVWVARLLRPFQ